MLGTDAATTGVGDMGACGTVACETVTPHHTFTGKLLRVQYKQYQHCAWSKAWSLSKAFDSDCSLYLMMSSHELAADQPLPPGEPAVQQLPPEQPVERPGESDMNSHGDGQATCGQPEDDGEGHQPDSQNKQRNLTGRGEGGHAIRSAALKRKIDRLWPELQNAVLAVKQITKHCATATAVDHHARRNHSPIGASLPGP
eukprot:3660712-Rhodomonas_salina.2